MIDQHFSTLGAAAAHGADDAAAAAAAADFTSLADMIQPDTSLPDESPQAVASAALFMIIARALGERDGPAHDAAPPARHPLAAAAVQPYRSDLNASLPPPPPSAAAAQDGAAAHEFDAFITASDRRQNPFIPRYSPPSLSRRCSPVDAAEVNDLKRARAYLAGMDG
jgi:hypothetical protein